jgi:predicted membrane chloride channel (bestrophin family)
MHGSVMTTALSSLLYVALFSVIAFAISRSYSMLLRCLTLIFGYATVYCVSL